MARAPTTAPDDTGAATYSEWRRHRMCDRKRAWPSEQLAANFATLLGWANPDQPEQHPYRCLCCDSWHLTSQTQEGTP